MASKEEAAQVAADRIKAAALNAAKGLSRVQAERAAAAAARNVNAYGQKEEGPSRWQERKEAKRQMYLMSTEKAVKLGVRKDLMKSAGPDRGVSASQQCQKCFQTGHWTYECKNERVYMSRPSRSQQLRNPKLKMRVSVSCEIENAENEAMQRNGDDRVGVAENKKKRSKSGGDKKKRKRKYFSGSSGSDTSDSESGSVSESSYSSSTTSTDASDSSTDSERRRRARRHRKGKSSRKRYSSSSSESESSDLDDSSSDSDSYDRSRKSRKSRPSRSSKRHGRS